MNITSDVYAHPDGRINMIIFMNYLASTHHIPADSHTITRTEDIKTLDVIPSRWIDEGYVYQTETFDHLVLAIVASVNEWNRLGKYIFADQEITDFVRYHERGPRLTDDDELRLLLHFYRRAVVYSQSDEEVEKAADQLVARVRPTPIDQEPTP